jgi:TetR/AcrR family fatty acid metabolism transcriptional regulator
VAERSTAVEEKRRHILDAAERVFARKGFHTSRVGDIAAEAGVAHGLLYHYFESKDELLETIFRENWSVLLDRIAAVEETDEPVQEQLRGVVKILLRTWLHRPDIVRIVVREFGRSPEVAPRLGELAKPIQAIERLMARGIERGELRSDLDPKLAATVFYGAIDELLTAWVLGRLRGRKADVAEGERIMLEVVLPALGAETPAAV